MSAETGDLCCGETASGPTVALVTADGPALVPRGDCNFPCHPAIGLIWCCSELGPGPIDRSRGERFVHDARLDALFRVDSGCNQHLRVDWDCVDCVGCKVMTWRMGWCPSHKWEKGAKFRVLPDRTITVLSNPDMFVAFKNGKVQLIRKGAGFSPAEEQCLVRAQPYDAWKRGESIFTPGHNPMYKPPPQEKMHFSGFDPSQDLSRVACVGAAAKGGMVLTKRGSPNQCVFENAARLAAGEFVRLSLVKQKAGGEHLGICKKHLEEKRFGPWRYVESAIGAAEVSVWASYEEGNYVKLATSDLVLDVAFWKMEVGNAVNFVGGTTKKEKTKQVGGGRDFVINVEDGTIGCKHHPHLVLGLPAPAMELLSAPPAPRSDEKLICPNPNVNMVVIASPVEVPSAPPAPRSDEKLICPNPNVNMVVTASPMEVPIHVNMVPPVPAIAAVSNPGAGGGAQQQQFISGQGAAPQMVVQLQSPQQVQIGGGAAVGWAYKTKTTSKDEQHKENMKRENEKAHARQQGMFVGLLGTMAVLPCCFCLAKAVGENGADIAEGAGEAVGVCGQAAGGCIKLVENLFN